MIQESGSIPTSKDRGAPRNCTKYKIFIGRRGKGKGKRKKERRKKERKKERKRKGEGESKEGRKEVSLYSIVFLGV